MVAKERFIDHDGSSVEDNATVWVGNSVARAAHVPQYGRHAKGLQIAEKAPPRTSSSGYSEDLILDERFLRPTIGPSISSPGTLPASLSPEYHVCVVLPDLLLDGKKKCLHVERNP